MDRELQQVYNSINLGKYSEAEEKIREMLKKDANKAKAYTAMGLIYEKRGKLKEAVDNFSKAHGEDPSDPVPLQKLAENWMLLDNPDKSLMYVKQLEKIDKPDIYKNIMKAEFILMRGARRKQKNDGRWLKDLEEAKNILSSIAGSDKWEYMVASANLHLLRGEKREAARMYEMAVNTGSVSPQTNIDVLMALTVLNQELGNNEKAVEYAEKLISFLDEWKPDEYSRSLYQREYGLLYLHILLNRPVDTNRMNTHRRYYRKLYEDRLQLPAVEVDQTLYILSEMADMEYDEGISGPLEEVNEFMSLAEGPPYPQCFFNIMINRKVRYMLGYIRFGDVYREFGKNREAEKYYKKALKYSPDNPEILKRIKGL